MNLASLEPHPTRADQELKTFKCLHCGKQHVFTVQKRRGRSPTTRAEFGGA
jgi:transcription elongation factor Elf1